MTLSTWSVLFVIALISPAHGQEDSHGDVADQCLARSGGVTLNMIECHQPELERQEAALAVLWKKELAAAPPGLKEILQNGLKHWVSYRDNTCQAEISKSGGGSFASISHLDCKIRLTRERIDWLQHLHAEDSPSKWQFHIHKRQPPGSSGF